jgi:hypothetical protein
VLLAVGYAIGFALPLQGSIYTNSLYVPAELLQMYGAMILLPGLSGIIVRLVQGQKAARMGLIGCVMIFPGIATLEIGMTAISAFIFPTLASHPATRSLTGSPAGAALVWYLVGLAGTLFGSLLLGIAIVRARALPRLAGVMLIAAVPFFFFSLIDDPLVSTITGIGFALTFGLGCAWCGYGLFAQRKEEEVQVTFVTQPAQDMVASNGHAIVSPNHRNVEVSKSR